MSLSKLLSKISNCFRRLFSPAAASESEASESEASPPSPSPSPSPVETIPVSPPPIVKTCFLLDDARTRVMNALSPSVSDAQYEALLQRLLRLGCNTVWFYTCNDGDGPGRTWYWSGGFLSAVDYRAVAAIRARLARARALGLWLTWWRLPDDSGRAIPYGDPVALLRYFQQADLLFRDLFDDDVVALEADTTLGYTTVVRLADYLRQGGRRVGLHLDRNRFSWSRDIAYVNVHYHQYDLGLSPTAIARETAAVIASVKKPLIASEYHRSGSAAAARALGQAVLRVPGCVGAGTGF